MQSSAAMTITKRAVFPRSRMAGSRTFISNPVLMSMLAFALVSNAALWWFVALRNVPAAETIPLHYNIYFGIDLLGPWWYFFILPSAGFVTLVLNCVLAMFLYTRERVASYVLSLTSCAVQIALFFTAFIALTYL